MRGHIVEAPGMQWHQHCSALQICCTPSPNILADLPATAPPLCEVRPTEKSRPCLPSVKFACISPSLTPPLVLNKPLPVSQVHGPFWSPGPPSSVSLPGCVLMDAEKAARARAASMRTRQYTPVDLTQSSSTPMTDEESAAPLDSSCRPNRMRPWEGREG
ncbi:hypothetical protein Vafri_18398, partial [Volvox africanus]